MYYFLTISKIQNVAFLRIERNSPQEPKYFKLTKKGCIDAGKFLFNEKQENWQHSSTLDFPHEIKPSFRYNVLDLIQEGYQLAQLNLDKPANESLKDSIIQQARVGDYEIRGNQYVAIAVNVNNPKDSHYFDIDPDVNNNAFIRAQGWAYEPEDDDDRLKVDPFSDDAIALAESLKNSRRKTNV
jgi:hypothetical protein